MFFAERCGAAQLGHQREARTGRQQPEREDRHRGEYAELCKRTDADDGRNDQPLQLQDQCADGGNAK